MSTFFCFARVIARRNKRLRQQWRQQDLPKLARYRFAKETVEEIPF